MLRGANQATVMQPSAPMLAQKAKMSAVASDTPFGLIWYL